MTATRWAEKMGEDDEFGWEKRLVSVTFRDSDECGGG